MHLLGLEVTDANGTTLGQVVDTYPFDGGGELEMIVLRLRRFGERRMLPVSELRLDGGRLVAPVHAPADRGLARPRRPPDRGRPLALEVVLVLGGPGHRGPLVACGGDGAPALAAAARRGRAARLQARRRARAHGPRRATGTRRGSGPRPARTRVQRVLHEPEGPRARHRRAGLPGAQRRARRARRARRGLRPRRRRSSCCTPMATTRGCSSSATSPTSRRWCTTSPAGAWTSRRAGSPASRRPRRLRAAGAAAPARARVARDDA